MNHILPIPGFADPFSSLSHLLGAVLFALLSVPLLRRGAGDAWRWISLAMFCFGSVLLLSISGVYHLLDPGSDARAVMQRLDHAAIFVLIASTFTPVHMILFRGWGRWGMLALIWSLAIASITLKTVYFNDMPRHLGIAMYLGVGWVGMGAGVTMWHRFGFRFIQSLLWGGLAYTIGAILFGFCWPTLIPGIVHSHEVFHVAVLMGLAFHWEFIYAIADGRSQTALESLPASV